MTRNPKRSSLKTADDYRRQANRYARYAADALAKSQAGIGDRADHYSREAGHFAGQARHYATLADLASSQAVQPTLTETGHRNDPTADQATLF